MRKWISARRKTAVCPYCGKVVKYRGVEVVNELLVCTYCDLDFRIVPRED